MSQEKQSQGDTRALRELHIVIPNQTPSKKNNKRIVYNKKTKRPFIISSEKAKDWEAEAKWILLKYAKGGPLENRVELTATFYVKDLRRRDLDNMLTSCQDVLVESGILKDDSWISLKIANIDAELDRENPRAEIFLQEIQ